MFSFKHNQTVAKNFKVAQIWLWDTQIGVIFKNWRQMKTPDFDPRLHLWTRNSFIFGFDAQVGEASFLEVNLRRKRRRWAYHFYLVRFRPWDPTNPRFWKKTKHFFNNAKQDSELTTLQYNLGDLNLWCQRVCHLMIRRECLKKVLLCNMLRFPTIQFVHMQTFATTSCQIQNDALQFFINSVDWRLHSDNFKFSVTFARICI